MAESDRGTPAKGWVFKPQTEMDDKQFRQWQTLLESRTGMSLAENRKTFLQTNLGIRMREIGCATYQEYFDKVNSGTSGMIEWTTLVDRLTVQETRFYRDPDAYALLTEYVMTQPRDNLVKQSFEAWSVGCSTGEEPYTLAILLSECMSALGLNRYFGVTGTDISTPALEKAKAGIYNAAKLVTLSNELKDKYFTLREDKRYEISQALKSRVCFSRVNIVELSSAPIHGMNIIFCQNVLIYFRRWRRKEILNRLAERLVPGGMLILGQGEIVDWKHPLLQRVSSDKALAFIRRPDTK